MIKANSHKYSISAMCRVLRVPRSTYYYESTQLVANTDLEDLIVEIFRQNRSVYGTRKLKVELAKKGFIVSRRRIGRIMKQQGLASKYTIAKFKPHVDKCNESKISNELNRKFDNQERRAVVVSDLTYVRVGKAWHYICVLVDLFNREIIGFSAGRNKDAPLVQKAFASVTGSLNDIALFHTDRGNEFKNKLIDETLATFGIRRSLSMKGCPYDNAVAEATFKIIKTEFVYGTIFSTISELSLELADYVHWFNNFRIHSSLNYLTPCDYKINTLKKLFSLLLTIQFVSKPVFKETYKEYLKTKFASQAKNCSICTNVLAFKYMLRRY